MNKKEYESLKVGDVVKNRTTITTTRYTIPAGNVFDVYNAHFTDIKNIKLRCPSKDVKAFLSIERHYKKFYIVARENEK